MEKINKHFLTIKNIVLDMGGAIEEFVPERNSFYVKLEGKSIMLENNISITRQSFVSVRLTKCKDIAYKLLLANGIHSPATESFYNQTYDKTISLEKLNKLKYPIVLKKAVGSNSRGIYTSVKDSKEAIKILDKELSRYKSMIAQEMVFGKEYRILVLGEKVIGALEMISPHVIGDGASSIKKLIKEMQSNTKERTKFDKKLAKILKNQNVSLRTVLPKDKIIYIKRNSCLAQGGETRDVTDLVHKDVRDICVNASKTVGKYLVGVDAICKDISKKQTSKSFNVLELNGKPDLFVHYDPTYGKSRNVFKDVLKFLAKISVTLPTGK